MPKDALWRENRGRQFDINSSNFGNNIKTELN